MVKLQVAQAIKIGALSVYFETKGAFTAAVSAPMLKSIGCSYVLVGHSERRSVFGESNTDINKSLKQVQAHGMVPILCVGETLEEYEQGSANFMLVYYSACSMVVGSHCYGFMLLLDLSDSLHSLSNPEVQLITQCSHSLYTHLVFVSIHKGSTRK